jgi:hypothetical protein
MRKQEDVKEVVTGEEAEVASVVVEKDTTDRLVCVHCGRPWEGIKNVCECGGVCSWGYALSGEPLSWTKTENGYYPTPPPASAEAPEFATNASPLAPTPVKESLPLVRTGYERVEIRDADMVYDDDLLVKRDGSFNVVGNMSNGYVNGVIDALGYVLRPTNSGEKDLGVVEAGGVGDGR